MNNKVSLKEVARKTYMSYHQDGLLDIFVGVYVLLFGFGILLLTITDFSTWFVVPAIFPAVMGPIWVAAKKRITMPRIGYVKFGGGNVTKLMAILMGLAVAALGTFMVFTFAASQGWALTVRNLIIANGLIIIGIVAAAMSSLFAYTMGLKRLYAYGLLTLMLFLAGHFIPLPIEYLLFTIGLAIILNGFVLLIGFLRKHPLPQGDTPIAQEPS